MIRLVLTLIVTLVSIGGIKEMPNSARLKIIDTIQGSSFLSVQSAMEVLKHHNPDLAQSKIEVIRKGISIVVILVDKNEPENSKKSIGVMVDSNAELNARDLHVLRSDEEQSQLLDQIKGSSFPPTLKAFEIFRQRNPDLTQYDIKVVSKRDSLVVIFSDKDRPAGIRGSIGKPGFEVEMNARDLTVIRSNFVR